MLKPGDFGSKCIVVQSISSAKVDSRLQSAMLQLIALHLLPCLACHASFLIRQHPQVQQSDRALESVHVDAPCCLVFIGNESASHQIL